MNLSIVRYKYNESMTSTIVTVEVNYELFYESDYKASFNNLNNINKYCFADMGTIYIDK